MSKKDCPIVWHQAKITISKKRGCHLITNNVVNAVNKELSTIQVGMMNVFCKHTSASLSINENCDPSLFLFFLLFIELNEISFAICNMKD